MLMLKNRKNEKKHVGRYLKTVSQQLHWKEEGESFVGVPENRRVPDGEDQQGQGVVDEFWRAGPPVVLGRKVGADLSCRVVEGSLSGRSAWVNGSAGQELKDHNPIRWRNEPVQISFPDVIWNWNIFLIQSM